MTGYCILQEQEQAATAGLVGGCRINHPETRCINRSAGSHMSQVSIEAGKWDGDHRPLVSCASTPTVTRAVINPRLYATTSWQSESVRRGGRESKSSHPAARPRTRRCGRGAAARRRAPDHRSWRPAVESSGDGRLLSAATVRLSKHERGADARCCFADRVPAAVARHDGVAGWPRLTSATSRRCSRKRRCWCSSAA
jgi:hypothetical protein